jgi:hypothetical protein
MPDFFSGGSASGLNSKDFRDIEELGDFEIE